MPWNRRFSTLLLTLALMAGGAGGSFGDAASFGPLPGPTLDSPADGPAPDPASSSGEAPSAAALSDSTLLELAPPEPRPRRVGVDLPTPRDSAGLKPVSARPPPR